MKRLLAFGSLLAFLFLLFSNSNMSRVFAESQLAQSFTFVQHLVDSTPELVGMLITADVDDDQDLDLIGSIKTSGVYKIVWWENDGTPAGGSWQQRDIGSSAEWITEVEAADLDGDLDFDVAMTSNQGGQMLWFENDGAPLDGGWIEHVISSNKPFDAFALADVDSDLDIDVVVDTNTNNDLVWYENDGIPADGAWYPYYMIYTNCDECNSIRAVDINRDSLPDILVTADEDNLQDYDTLYFLLNDGSPLDGGWIKHTLEGSWHIWEADAGDIDGDEDIDVVGALQSGSVLLWENNGGSGSTWSDYPVAASFDNPSALHLVDLDQDNDLDILGASYVANEIAWFENDGSPLDGGWVWQTIENAYEDPRYAGPADIDGDGDWDVVGATEGGVFWWEESLNYLIHLPVIIR